MSQKKKLLAKLKSNPKDFTFDEAETLLGYYSYTRTNKGKTSGSRVKFIRKGYKAIMLHKPHPRNVLSEYQVRDLLAALKNGRLI